MQIHIPLEKRIRETLSIGATLILMAIPAGYVGNTASLFLAKNDVETARSSVQMYENAGFPYQALFLGTYLSDRTYLKLFDRQRNS
jgi:hypothetical protein